MQRAEGEARSDRADGTARAAGFNIEGERTLAPFERPPARVSQSGPYLQSVRVFVCVRAPVCVFVWRVRICVRVRLCAA